MTRLPGRVLLEDRIDQSLQSARRRGGRITVMVCALARLPGVYDSLGRAAEEQVLRLMSARISKCIADTDSLGRLGSNEFVILAKGLAGPADAAAIAKKVLDATSLSCKVDDHELSLGAHVGLALGPEDGDTAAALLERAGIALHAAALVGSHERYAFFSEQMTVRARQSLRMESDLRHAIERGELELHYQPQFAAADLSLWGLEALVRWRGPGGALVPPGEFIPMAETNGLIVPLGEWVLRSACHQTRRWRSATGLPLRTAVNVSPRQLDAGIVDLVARVLDDTKLEPAALELEMTESSLADGAHIQETLSQLEALGVRISIDDFGTGYSSLAYLGRFPVDALKVDRTFVRRARTDHTNAMLCRTIVGLGRNLGLEVVAEGIEDADELAFIRETGADAVQGFHLGRPMPPAELEAKVLHPAWVAHGT